MRNFNRFLIICFVLFGAQSAIAASPTYDSSWEWNRGVKIKVVYSLWNESKTYLLLDNGQYCHIDSGDDRLYASALAMRAEQSVGEVVCSKDPSGSINGADSRRLHRLAY